jgi:uncharacterized membrane protein YkvA (DUF1232 family)
MQRKSLKERARELKHEVKALALALKHPRLPWAARLVIIIAVGYALSPIDLIPDFIPVLGLLDDLIILPALILLAVRLMPAGLMDECRHEAETKSVDSKAKWGAMIFIIAVWAVLLGALGVWIARLVGAKL